MRHFRKKSPGRGRWAGKGNGRPEQDQKTSDLSTVKALAELKADISRQFNQLFFHNYLRQDIDSRLLILAGRQMAMELRRIQKVRTLHDVEFKVFSQFGEDGIIEWLLQNIPIPSRTFVEFGVENYREANTRFLVQHHNWRGLIMDSDPKHEQTLRRESLYWMYDVIFKPAFITAENINDLITDAGFAGELGLLSIDIDGNDYWVLKSINCVKPAIIICEYNAIFGDVHPVTIPYRLDFSRFEGHFSGLYFGASIAALISLGESKGYRFLGSGVNGINAFFVRNDLFPYLEQKIDEFKAWSSLVRDSRDDKGELHFTRGLDRYNLIKHLPVIHVITGEKVSLESLGPAFSAAWQLELEGRVLK